MVGTTKKKIMKGGLIALLLLVSFSFCASPAVTPSAEKATTALQTNPNSFQSSPFAPAELMALTAEEKAWLAENRNLIFTLPQYWYNSERAGNGEHQGFFIDYLALINRYLDSQFAIQIKSDTEIGELVMSNKLSVLFANVSGEASKAVFDYTQPILNIPYAVYNRRGFSRIDSLEKLAGSKVGVYNPLPEIASSSAFDVLSVVRDVDAVGFKTLPGALTALNQGDVDAVYGNQLNIEQSIADSMIMGIKLNWVDPEHSSELGIGVNKHIPHLRNILVKMIHQLEGKDKVNLHNKWFVPRKVSVSSAPIQFSQSESDWIKNNPLVYFSDLTWMPYIKVGDSTEEVEGIAKDYLDRVAKESGIDFRFIKHKSWSSIIDSIKQGHITLTLAAGKTEERQTFADFTEPFTASPLVVVTAKGFSYVQDLTQLEGLSVAMPTGLFVSEYVSNNYPRIKLIDVKTIAQAYDMVANGKADAYIGNMAVAAHYLRSSNASNLRIAGAIDHEPTIHFMLAKGHPELLSIFNKVINSVTESEKRSINNRWFSINYQLGIAPTIFWQVIITGAVLMLIVLYWVRRLRKEIALRRLTEASLESARHNAERANLAKSEFLANMSHEIRTPMNAVIGFTQLLMDTELSAKQKNYLDSIRVGSNGLLHIINDILDLSKIEAGKLSIDQKPLDLAALLGEMNQLFKSSMQEKGVDFSIEIAPEVPEYLILDGNRVRQILVNLIGNAQQFTDFGSITLKAYSTRYSDDAVNLNLYIDIKDTGIGISADSMDKIFSSFEQLKNPSIHKYAGTGLGLAISRRLAEKMNGEISAKSEVGKGSCFRLKINDVAIASLVSPTVVEKAKYQFEKAIVMVVDDVASNRMIICKYLEGLPFELVQAKDGVEAVDVALKIKPDLILMDLRMPKLDGYDATVLIKKKLDAPVVALTASALKDKESTKQRAIFDDYLRKPILKTKLMESLAKFLSYRVDQQETAPPEIKIEISDEHKVQFQQTIRARILSDLGVIGSDGQFDKIEIFAQELLEISMLFHVAGLETLASQLQSAASDFDIEKIDKLLSRLKQEFQQLIEVEP